MDHPVAPPGTVASREHPPTGLNPQTPPATQAQFWRALHDKLRNWASWPRNAPTAATVPQTTSHNVTIDTNLQDLERQALVPEVQWEITPSSILISTLYYGNLICHLFIPAIYHGRIQHIFDESGHTMDKIVAIFHANHRPAPNIRTTVIKTPQTVDRGGPGRSSNSVGESGREAREQSGSGGSDDSPRGGGKGGPDGRGGGGGEEGEEEKAGGQGGAERAQLVEWWNDIVDQFVEEWKAMSIISALLVPGGFTWFSIVNAANDPVVRGLAFISIMLAFWSLICCCFYVIQLRRMKNDRIIAKLALEILNESPAWWNACFMLSLPAVWLTWSIIIFLAAIFVFMWRARANLPDDFSPNTPPHTEFVFRVLACVTSGLAFVSFVAAVVTSYKYIQRARPA